MVVIDVDKKTKARIIRHYDVDALMKEIEVNQKNIITFNAIFEKAVRLNDEKNILAYSEAIKKAEKDIAHLKECIKIVEESKNATSI